jgi:hypothetical protein
MHIWEGQIYSQIMGGLKSYESRKVLHLEEREGQHYLGPASYTISRKEKGHHV